jgi:hypothetical protein
MKGFMFFIKRSILNERSRLNDRDRQTIVNCWRRKSKAIGLELGQFETEKISNYFKMTSWIEEKTIVLLCEHNGWGQKRKFHFIISKY